MTDRFRQPAEPRYRDVCGIITREFEVDLTAFGRGIERVDAAIWFHRYADGEIAWAVTDICLSDGTVLDHAHRNRATRLAKMGRAVADEIETKHKIWIDQEVADECAGMET